MTIESPDDALIGRLIDSEARPQDLETFEHLARRRPELWRTLALQHLEMDALSGRVMTATGAAERVEAAPPPRRGNLALMLSGWAAVVVMGVAWMTLPLGPPPARPGFDRVLAPEVADRELTADEHLAAYLSAPFVRGELDPMLLETEPLDDGRYRLWILRRIEEHVDVESPIKDLVDDEGRLTVPPAELRRDDT